MIMSGAKLKRLFEKRQLAFDRATEVIEVTVRPALDACREYIRGIQGDDFADRVEWVGMALTGDESQNFTAFAVVRYEVGMPFTDSNGNYIAALSEIDVYQMNQTFQVVLPLELAENGNAEDIFAYFKEREAATREMSEAWEGAFDGGEISSVDEDSELSSEELEYLKRLNGKDVTIH